jgi:hypothetical protein
MSPTDNQKSTHEEIAKHRRGFAAEPSGATERGTSILIKIYNTIIRNKNERPTDDLIHNDYGHHRLLDSKANTNIRTGL